jgi:hypothetical protein
MAVWIERTQDGEGRPGAWLLYAVGPPGSELTQVFQLGEAAGPELDRAMALKVRELVDRARATATAEVHHAAAATATTAPPVATTPALALELGGAAALGEPSWQAGPVVAIATTGGVAGARVDGYVLATYAGVVDDAGAAGQVAFRELGAAVGARALTPGSVGFGAGLELGTRLLHARGVTPGGATATEWVVVPTATAAVAVEWRLGRRIELRLAAGAELALTRQQLAVNNTVVTDLGRVRPMARLSLAIFIP